MGLSPYLRKSLPSPVLGAGPALSAALTLPSPLSTLPSPLSPLHSPLSPFISVIVPVRNEAQFIERTLNQLIAQDYASDRFEILVVDGQSTDATPHIVRQFIEGAKGEWLRLPDRPEGCSAPMERVPLSAADKISPLPSDGRGAGGEGCADSPLSSCPSPFSPSIRLFNNPKRLSSAARNIGIQNAQGDVVVVVDGHCELDGQYLTRLAGAFDRSRADCIGRPQPLDISGASTLQCAIAAARSSRLGHHPDSFIYSSAERFAPAESVAVAYRRSVFDRVGLFDETFDACEDVELNHRIDRAGLRCWFTPEVAVHYAPRATLAGLFRQLVRYGRGRVRLVRKHPKTFSWGLVPPTLLVAGLLVGLLVGLPLSLVSGSAALVYVAPIAIYAAVVLAASASLALSLRHLRLLFALPLVFLTIHVASGMGMLWELFRPAGQRRAGSLRPKTTPSVIFQRRFAADQIVEGTNTPLHVVIVDEELPYPPNSGKRIRTLNLLLPLAARHRITYLCYPSADADETARAVDYFRQQGIETVLVDRPLPGKTGPMFYGRLLYNLLSPLPYSVQVHNSEALRRAVRRYAAAHDVDLWHCEWMPYGQTLHSLTVGPWIAVAHNVESLIWQRYAENEPNRPKRWYITRQWRKFERFEQRMFSAARRTIAVSECDARLMQDQFGATRVDVVDNGVDIGYFHPNGSTRDPFRLLFLGSLDWRPNLNAVELLLDRIFPRLLAQEPLTRLAIVGRKPPQWLVERVRACPGVELHADVPDVRPFLAQCGLMVVPLRIGGGSRLKILEALAAECPVVSTRIGAEGLRLVPGEHFVQVETADDMAAALLEHIRDPRPILAMARQGRTAVTDRYNWPALSTKLEAIWLEQARARWSEEIQIPQGNHYRC